MTKKQMRTIHFFQDHFRCQLLNIGRPGIFAHGFVDVSYGTPWQGHLTNWHSATHAQHAFFGYPEDAFSLTMVPMAWFDTPVQLFTCHNPGQKERTLRTSTSMLLFTPTSMESLKKNASRLDGAAFSSGAATAPMAAPGLSNSCSTLEDFAMALPGSAEGSDERNSVDEAELAIQVPGVIVHLIKSQHLQSICWRQAWGNPWQNDAEQKSTIVSPSRGAPNAQTNWQSPAMWQTMLDTLRQVAPLVQSHTNLQNRLAQMCATFEQVVIHSI